MAALALTVVGRASAEQKGIDSTLYHEGRAIGCGSPTLGQTQGCHAEFASELVAVTIEGPAALDTGGAALFAASAESASLDQAGAGINVWIDPLASTSDCRLDPFPTDDPPPGAKQLIRKGSVLSHQDADAGPPFGSLGVFSYQFLLWDCQAPGSVRLLVAMNTFNYDEDVTGDAWNQAAATITVPEPAAAPAVLGAAGALATAARRRRGRA
jgi:hypothetical protein